MTTINSVTLVQTLLNARFVPSWMTKGNSRPEHQLQVGRIGSKPGGLGELFAAEPSCKGMMDRRSNHGGKGLRAITASIASPVGEDVVR